MNWAQKLFKSMLGKVHTVPGFDRIGNVELEPKRLNTVWVEPEFWRLHVRKAKKRKSKQTTCLINGVTAELVLARGELCRFRYSGDARAHSSDARPEQIDYQISEIIFLYSSSVKARSVSVWRFPWEASLSNAFAIVASSGASAMLT